ncbi:hypothetical protein BL247_10870 [Ralstonia solanacearum]|nr:hypothetical protein AC251_00930 [Ralstonia pseudosolanacearum]OIN72558.1 hypothetical protein BL247_10870 [Ralstonia solanacearum]
MSEPRQLKLVININLMFEAVSATDSNVACDKHILSLEIQKSLINLLNMLLKTRPIAIFRFVGLRF